MFATWEELDERDIVDACVTMDTAELRRGCDEGSWRDGFRWRSGGGGALTGAKEEN